MVQFYSCVALLGASLVSGASLNIDYSKLLEAMPSNSVPIALPYNTLPGSNSLQLPAQIYSSTSQLYQPSQVYSSPGAISSSIYSNHKVSIDKTPSKVEREELPMIVIDSDAIPIKMLFKTTSAKMDIKQMHQNAEPNTVESNSVDGEIVLKHTVKKPVFQYIYEEIVPQRFLTQKIEPVKEFVKTVISKSDSSAVASVSDSADNKDSTSGDEKAKY